MSEVRLFDSHCHLDLQPLAGQLERIKADAFRRGVNQVMVPAVDRPGFERVLELKRADPDWLRIGLGLHPCFMDHHRWEHLHQLEDYLNRFPQLICALGEVGLDWAVPGADRDVQIGYLEYQLKLARQYRLPVVIHVRKAHPELQQLLKRIGPLPRGGVIHGFSGGPELAKSYLRLGMKLGIGATITYPRGVRTREALALLPLDSFVLETDAPSMPVCGYQGQYNEPKRLSLIFEAFCACRTESLTRIQAVLWQTSDTLFIQKTASGEF